MCEMMGIQFEGGSREDTRRVEYLGEGRCATCFEQCVHALYDTLSRKELQAEDMTCLTTFMTLSCM